MLLPLPPQPTITFIYIYSLAEALGSTTGSLPASSDFCCCCCHVYSVFSRLSIILSFLSAAGMKKRRLQTRLQEQWEELGCKNGRRKKAGRIRSIQLHQMFPACWELGNVPTKFKPGARKWDVEFWNNVSHHKAQGWSPFFSWRSNVDVCWVWNLCSPRRSWTMMLVQQDQTAWQQQSLLHFWLKVQKNQQLQEG